MPSFRGIEASILTQLEIGRLPEYPHPDGCPSRLPDSTNTLYDGKPSPREDDDQVAGDHVSIEVPTANPMVSVYVPSLPGAQFWLNYVVEQDPHPTGHLFFKLYMNGRHITSWGINPRIKSKGRVEKALYEPSDRFDQEENGVLFKQQGIEARYFYFVSNQEELSVADDGGLIELQVFRAKGRKRRAAKLDRYRQQDRYGITTPSGGLLDNPQDVTFFDFHLLDPKDAPFASFRFHYRSLANLKQLNLIPTDEPSILESSTPSTASKDLEPVSEADETTSIEQESSTSIHIFPVQPDADESVFYDSPSNDEIEPFHTGNLKPRRNSTFVLRTPPQLRPRSATSRNLPQPSKTIRDALPPGVPDTYHQRPLPDRPLPELPTDGPKDSWVPRSRKSSTASAAPSIAQSLLSYVKNGSFLSDTVEYGQAQQVQMDRDHPGVPLNQDNSEKSKETSPPPIDISMSDYEASPGPVDDSKENNLSFLSPGNYLASTGSMLEKHIARLETQSSPCGHRNDSTGGHNKSSRVKDTADVNDDQYSPCGSIERSRSNETSLRARDTVRGHNEFNVDFSKFPHLQLAESDWIRRTPSPQAVPRRILSPRLGRLWNTLRRTKSRSPLRNIEDNSSRNYSTPQLHGPRPEVKERHGKWI